MPIFKQFPKIGYDFELNGVKQNVVDIFRHVKPIQEFIDNYAQMFSPIATPPKKLIL